MSDPIKEIEDRRGELEDLADCKLPAAKVAQKLLDIVDSEA
jgi:hypothetical protein